ncbi:signal transduction histidine kinase [Glycomyces artemisiae]|uniref:histidine kinase n=1 Tax=Glycomyces artemisiae TaxID=1076443 RepID=A0A2T0UP66_9ACTN|nr:signal transduction histidine kinase [Glycomyces artemisiae]
MDGVNLRRWSPDRRVDRGPLWILIDLAVAYLSAVISIGPSDHVASVADGPLLERAAAVVWFAAIAGRRFAPATALWAASAATAAVALAGLPVMNASLATAMALTLVLRSRPLRFAIESSCVPVVAVLVVLVPVADAFVPALLAHAVAVVVGRAGRVRWEAQETMRRSEIEREREAAAERVRQARAAERTRMARELHDAVGHAVTVMVAHAGAARFALAGDREEITAVLGSIERVGREAMRDLDGVLGLLADEEDAADQGLEESLRALLASLPAEVTAELRVPGEALAGLGSEAAAAVRRVVQESLTNVIRHARPAHAVVEVERGADWVQVSVRDNGSGPVPQSSRQGRGLAGMRERVAALGGEWESGPLDSGGWRNRARLPLTEEAA